jgi:hypothetical protein
LSETSYNQSQLSHHRFPNGCCTGGHWGPPWTSTHQCTIHWIPVKTQLCMILNWVTTQFQLPNPFYKK